MGDLGEAVKAAHLNMASWRLARSLGRLRTQIDDKFPGRSKLADGTIGDAAHRARGSASDHNAWIKLGNLGIVSALDLTHDPKKGVDTYALAEHLRLTCDRRIKYVISARRIFSSTNQPWVWRSYSGTPHTGHIHISVVTNPALFDDNRDWGVAWGISIDIGADPARDVLRRGSHGEDVRVLQSLLSPPLTVVDGIFGPHTEAAVRAFQAEAGIKIDGIVGSRTWEHLEFLEPEPE